MRVLNASVLLCFMLLGCDDAVETEKYDLQVDLRGCLGVQDTGRPSTCRSQVSERVAAAPVNGCLVLVVGEAATVYHVGLRWTGDWFTLLEPPPIVGLPGESITGELYLFNDADAIRCDRQALPFGLACDPMTPWCLLKVVDADARIGVDGIRLDFGGDAGDCRPQGSLVYGADIEVCDGADNDCDGQVDEEEPGANDMCETAEPGACGRGITACRSGEIVCDSMPSIETCDGIDNDCDERIDEDYQVGENCFVGVGACQNTGRIVCDGVVTTRCDAEPGPSMPTEICDGIDNDCDGMVDNNDVSTGTDCNLGERGIQGVCAAGHNRCVDGEVRCEQTQQPGLEICNGRDDDCDGRQDEGFGLGDVCFTGRGQCEGQGVIQCDDRGGSQCTAVDAAEPRQERCDGVDDDCDGRVDEGYGLGGACEVGVGACIRGGVLQCANDTAECSVLPGSPTAETCDGIDQDCDGRIDEEIPVVQTDCGIGACARQGQRVCVQGRLVDTCQPQVPQMDDVQCDNADNDCDGRVDEAYGGEVRTCGIGACRREALTICRAGQIIDTCEPGAAQSDAQCDGIDDDCDGVADDDFIGARTNCGQGICTAVGVEDCRNGVLVDTCEAGPAEAEDTTCDGIDTDCDGRHDEGFVEQPTECGTGPCLRVGVLTCADGVVLDSCQVGLAPSASDETCDGIDDDCSGLVDEDYQAERTVCGQGLCASVGVSTCVGGRLGDTCEPQPGQLDDRACDGLDSDCDGIVDEDFEALQTTCGEGVCRMDGQTECIDGRLNNSCEAGETAGVDEECNGLDDDCDGRTDEGYVSIVTQCGVGACEAMGQSRCEDGIVVDDCQPGEPQAADPECNDIDADCDGRFGEDVEPTISSCGFGVCITQGILRCVDGALADNCVPLPADTPEICGNDVDEDCDGQLDNGFNLGEPCSTGFGLCRAEGTILCDADGLTSSCDAIPGDAVVEVCNLLDDDCDGVSDEGFDLESDSQHCGECNQVCSLANGRAGCTAGQCTLLECDPGFFDVDGDQGNGCEYECTPSAGGIEACDGEDNDCDGLVDEAFDLSTDDQNCGECGVQCGFAEACVNAACEFVPCEPLPYAIGETAVATTDDQPNVHAPSCGPAHGVELVYQFVPNRDQRVCLTTSGSAVDTILTVRRGTCQGNSLTCNANSATDGVGAEVEVNLRRDRLYLFVIDTVAPESGMVRLSSSFGRCTDGSPPIECTVSEDCLLPGQQCLNDKCAAVN